MPYRNCETKLLLTWCTDFVIFSTTVATKFAIIDAKLYVPVVTQDDAKPLQQLEPSFFFKKININQKQQSRRETHI